MKKIFFAIAATTVLFACNKEESKGGVFKSPHVTVHGGKAWSTVKLNKEGVPEQLSLVLNDAVLNTVPVGGPGDHTTHGNDIIIPVHQKGKESTPFQFIMLNWNPKGHEPAGVYDTAHFDFHFYMTDQATVNNYTDMIKLDNDPLPDYVPAAHMGVHPIPKMGKHWIDLSSPELGGQVPFTQTFIYGSYDKNVVFYEPMITLAFLKATTSFERPIPQPAKFSKAGYYPTKMKIVKSNGQTEVILDGFIYRTAS